MMTRKEQRSLLASLFDLKGLLPQTELAEGEQCALIEEILRAAEALCTRSLSLGRAAFYQELFGGMLTALQSASWDSMGAEQESEIRVLLAELLDAAIREVRAEQEVKKIFIFLPYKASMWDSLESIWKAAAEDAEHTEAHVVPIPYADRNPDGSAAAWHCEVDEFPDYVPVEDWRDYTLEQLKDLRPDGIFIHNPYDANNLVTSVEGQYYSARLKECTDCLVYVPYFVSGESVSQGTAVTPGVKNADYVIVESEKIRGQYISYTKPLGVNEKKFLALGSPKFDAVLSARKEDFSLPSAWEKILQGKKVVLFGTSLGAILQNTEHVCQKTREILAFFREHREIALWWRPHPLVRSTLKSMRGNVYEEYCQIEDEYKREGWGIFDDSSDLDRAIAWANVYYGDPSSVCTLFTAAKKPVVLHTYAPNPPKMIFCDIEVGTKELFFLDHFRSIFYRMDLATGIRKDAIPIPRKYCLSGGQFGVFLRDGEEVILFPVFGRRVCRFNLRTRQVEEILEVHNTYASVGDGNAYCVARCRDYAYVYGARTNEILRYDFRTGELARLTDWYEPLREEFGLYHEHAEENNVLIDSAVNGNIVMFAISRANLLLELNAETGEWRYHRIGGTDQQWQNIEYDGTYYWLMSRLHTPIVRWSRETGEVREYGQHLPLMKGFSGFQPFFFMECMGDSVILLRGKGPRSIRISKSTGEASYLEDTGATYNRKKLGKDLYVRYVVRNGTDYIVLESGEGEQAYPITYEFLHQGIPVEELGSEAHVYNAVLSLSDVPRLLESIDASANESQGEIAGKRIYRAIRDIC